MNISKKQCIELNKGQISNLRGVIAEKIVSMKRNDIENRVLDKVGDGWKILYYSEYPNFLDNWISIDGNEDKFLFKKEKDIAFSCFNPKNHLIGIETLFNDDKCFFMTKQAFKSYKNSSQLLQKEGSTIPDIKFLVYKINDKKVKVRRNFSIKSLDKKQKLIQKTITKEIKIIEEIKPVFVEIKSFKHSVKITKAQQKALVEYRNTHNFFYFIFNLNFNFEITPKIILGELQDRIYKKLN